MATKVIPLAKVVQIANLQVMIFQKNSLKFSRTTSLLICKNTGKSFIIKKTKDSFLWNRQKRS